MTVTTLYQNKSQNLDFHMVFGNAIVEPPNSGHTWTSHFYLYIERGMWLNCYFGVLDFSAKTYFLLLEVFFNWRLFPEVSLYLEDVPPLLEVIGGFYFSGFSPL